jgi:endonuclease YncB( thermonuclease family)
MGKKITRIIDGDTICFDKYTFFCFNKREMKVRLYGVDCPETKLNNKNNVDQKHKDAGLKVKDFVTLILLNKKVKLKYYKNEKDFYGRELCSVIHKNVDISEFLIEIGYGKKYNPKNKEKRYWNEEEIKKINEGSISEKIILFQNKIKKNNFFSCFY